MVDDLWLVIEAYREFLKRQVDEKAPGWWPIIDRSFQRTMISGLWDIFHFPLAESVDYFPLADQIFEKYNLVGQE